MIEFDLISKECNISSVSIHFRVQQGDYTVLTVNNFVRLFPFATGTNVNVCAIGSDNSILCDCSEKEKELLEEYNLAYRNGFLVCYKVLSFNRKNSCVDIVAYKSPNITPDSTLRKIDVRVKDEIKANRNFVFPFNNSEYQITLTFDEMADAKFLVGTDGATKEMVLLSLKKEAKPDAKGNICEYMMGEESNASNLVRKYKPKYQFTRNAYRLTSTICQSIKETDFMDQSKIVQNSFLEAWRKFSIHEKKTLEADMTSKKFAPRKFDSIHVSGDVVTLCSQTDCLKKYFNLVKESGYLECLEISNGDQGVLLLGARLEGNSIVANVDLDSIDEMNKRMRNDFQKISLTSMKNVRITTDLMTKMFERRQIAFDLFANSNAARDDFNNLLNGIPTMKRTHDKPDKVALDSVFNGGSPTPDQMEAITIALNTPDFAIIQGPPGTGKSQVIRAISACIDPPSNDETDMYTAYQRKTVRDLANKASEVFGIPFEMVESGVHQSNKYAQAEEWGEKVANKLRERYKDDDVMEYIFNTKKELSILNAIRMSLVGCKFGPDKALDSVSRLEKECPISSSQHREELEELSKTFSKGLSYDDLLVLSTTNKIHLLPKNEAQFGDGGIDNVISIIDELKFTLSFEKGFTRANELLSELTNEYKQGARDFNKIRNCILNLFGAIHARRHEIINPESNGRLLNLIDKMKKDIDKEDSESDKAKRVIANYILCLETNPVALSNSLREFQDRVFASHQMVDGKKLSGKTFRHLYVDEAARSCPPDLLIPLVRTKEKMILVGDQRQLPQFINQTVLDKADEEVLSDSEKRVLKITMFEQLIKSCNDLYLKDGFKRVVRLRTQFRMPKVLGDFIGQEFYSHDDDGNLLPEDQRGLDFGGSQSSHDHLIPGMEHKAMVFAAHSGKGTREEHSRSWVNVQQADTIFEFLKKCSNDAEAAKLSYGVISFYRAQAQLITELLEKEDNNGMEARRLVDVLDVESDTVDAYQGEQKDVIIISLVKNTVNPRDPKSISFLSDMNRLNVALSRAKKCCILVGNPNMLKAGVKELEPLRHFYKKCHNGEEGCLYVKW